MTVRVRDVLKILEEYAPRALAEDWDHIGLQLGHEDEEVRGVAVALDPSLAIVQEALEKGCNLLVTHHPLFFRSLHALNSRAPLGNLLRQALNQGLSVVAAHTNLDSAAGGINDLLAARFGLQEVVPLKPHPTNARVGLGRLGRLAKPLSQAEVIALIKQVFGVSTVRVSGEATSPIERLAICSGSGREFLGLARQQGAQCYITADVHYHDAVSAWEEGPVLVDPGHFAMEVPVVADLVRRLKGDLSRHGWEIPVTACRREKDPFDFL